MYFLELIEYNVGKTEQQSAAAYLSRGNTYTSTVGNEGAVGLLCEFAIRRLNVYVDVAGCVIKTTPVDICSVGVVQIIADNLG